MASPTFPISNSVQSALSRVVFIEELLTKIFYHLLEPESSGNDSDPAVHCQNLLTALSTCKSTYAACVEHKLGRQLCFLEPDFSKGVPQLNHFLFERTPEVHGHHHLGTHFGQQLALLILYHLGYLSKEFREASRDQAFAGIYLRESFIRSDASWRRMQVSKPATKILRIIPMSSEDTQSMFQQEGWPLTLTLKGSRGLTMGGCVRQIIRYANADRDKRNRIVWLLNNMALGSDRWLFRPFNKTIPGFQKKSVATVLSLLDRSKRQLEIPSDGI